MVIEDFEKRLMNVSPLSIPSMWEKRTLDLLGLVDKIKLTLHEKGKHIVSDRKAGGYRISIPSQNMLYVESYQRKAKRALNKAKKLSDGTKRLNINQVPDNTASYQAMLEEKLKKQQQLNDLI